MSKLLYLAVLVAAVVGGWYLHGHYQIEGLDNVAIKTRTGSPQETPALERERPAQPTTGPRRHSIRMASFNLGPLDRRKLDNRPVASYLIQVIRQFDVVAIQNVQARNRSPLVRLVELINSDGREYDFAAPEIASLASAEQYSAFLFDRDTIEIDRSTVYTVEDPARLLLRPPLVASFRTRGAAAEEAFTFTLINVHNDPNRAIGELDVLDDVFRAVRDDPRGEDDVILLGDLASDDRQFGELGQVANITWSVSGTPSTLRESRLVDNILFDRRATTEFTGRSGVLDLMVEFNVPMREALEVSTHFPVWAEFSLYEGGEAGHVAVTTR